MATLTPEQAKKVAKLPKAEGKTCLADCLDWDPSDYDDEINMRGAIHLEYLYGSLEFAATKGFPWQQVCAVLELAEEFVSKTVQNGVDIDQAIAIYKLLAPNYINRIGEKNLTIYTDYVFSTFMSHYKLYLYVFTRPREPQVSKCDLEVDIPPEVLELKVRRQNKWPDTPSRLPSSLQVSKCDLRVDIPPEVLELKEGKPERIWNYEQKMSTLEEEEKARIEAFRAQRETLENDEKIIDHAVMEKVEDKSAPLQQEDLTELIKTIAEAEVSHTEKIWHTKLEERNEDLDYYLQKTSMPRPPELGPPPRTKDPPRYSAKSKPPTRGAGTKTGMSEAKLMRSAAKSGKR